GPGRTRGRGGAGRGAARPPRCGRRAAGYASPTGSEQAQLARARGRLAPARPGLERLGALRLLGGRGLRREAGAAHRLPRRQRELVEAVVTVARVRRRVAAGLALGERAPDAAGGEIGRAHV